METRLLQIEKELPTLLGGFELTKKAFEYCQEIDKYYGYLGRQPSIKLTPEQEKVQFRRQVFKYQFHIDIRKKRFNTLMEALKKCTNPLDETNMEMELSALSMDINSKVDWLDSFKLRKK